MNCQRLTDLFPSSGDVVDMAVVGLGGVSGGRGTSAGAF